MIKWDLYNFFLQEIYLSLPDKGKKIGDFVEKVHLALAHLEEEERKQASLISVRTEFQAKYQHAFAKRSTDNHLEFNLDMIIPSHGRNKANVNIDVANIQENGGLLGQDESLTSQPETAENTRNSRWQRSNLTDERHRACGGVWTSNSWWK